MTRQYVHATSFVPLPLWAVSGPGDELHDEHDPLTVAARRRVAGTRVLVIDDYADARELYELYLSTAGYDVDAAEDAYAALRLLEAQQPDIILMDLSMPGMDGWELTRLLKTRQATAGIPILVVTAHGHAADRERAFAAGCDGYLVKPVAPSALARAIARELDRQH